MSDRLSDTAISIVNELHTERLDYNSEYIPLIDALNKLAEYEDFEEQGRLVKLPCKVGEIVYVHFYGEVILALLDEYTICANGTIIAKVYIDPDTYEEYEISEIYLTPEEATLKGADK